jgi:hypothetical protein
MLSNTSLNTSRSNEPQLAHSVKVNSKAPGGNVYVGVVGVTERRAPGIVRVIDPNQIAASRESDTLCRTTTNPLEGRVVDSFFLSIDWITVAMVIGVLVSVIAALVYIGPTGR